MTSSQKIWGAMIAVAIIAVGAYFYPHSTSTTIVDHGDGQAQLGAALPTDGSISKTLGTIYSYTNGQNGIVPGIWSDGVMALKTYLQFNAGVDSTSAATSTSYIETATVTNCSTASSTIFSVQNPFVGTSTLLELEITALNGATTTDIMVGTSTVPSPALTTSTATSSLGANILALFGFTNAAQLSVIANSDSGYETDGASSVTVSKAIAPVIVGPNVYVYGFSTSTGSGSGSRTIPSVPVSCTVEMKWNL